jgi:hypothetical protein
VPESGGVWWELVGGVGVGGGGLCLPRCFYVRARTRGTHTKRHSSFATIPAHGGRAPSSRALPASNDGPVPRLRPAEERGHRGRGLRRTRDATAGEEYRTCVGPAFSGLNGEAAAGPPALLPHPPTRPSATVGAKPKTSSAPQSSRKCQRAQWTAARRPRPGACVLCAARRRRPMCCSARRAAGPTGPPPPGGPRGRPLPGPSATCGRGGGRQTAAAGTLFLGEDFLVSCTRWFWSVVEAWRRPSPERSRPREGPPLSVFSRAPPLCPPLFRAPAGIQNTQRQKSGRRRRNRCWLLDKTQAWPSIHTHSLTPLLPSSTRPPRPRPAPTPRPSRRPSAPGAPAR